MAMYSDAIGFKLIAYNDSYHAFFAEVFREVKSFTPVQSFFEDKRNNIVKTFKNSLLGEPHTRCSSYLSQVLINRSTSAEELIKITESMTFEKFMKMKDKFL